MASDSQLSVNFKSKIITLKLNFKKLQEKKLLETISIFKVEEYPVFDEFGHKR